MGRLQAQRAIQMRWWHHSQVLQGHSISGLSDKGCDSRREPCFLSVFIVSGLPRQWGESALKAGFEEVELLDAVDYGGFQRSSCGPVSRRVWLGWRSLVGIELNYGFGG